MLANYLKSTKEILVSAMFQVAMNMDDRAPATQLNAAMRILDEMDLILGKILDGDYVLDLLQKKVMLGACNVTYRNVLTNIATPEYGGVVVSGSETKDEVLARLQADTWTIREWLLDTLESAGEDVSRERVRFLSVDC